MELRKTIIFIGHQEDDRKLFETATGMANIPCSFLALESESWTLRLLNMSQPFWFDSIFLDLENPSAPGIQFLKEIKSIPHLKHIPVVVYTDSCTRSNLTAIQENGGAHFIPKPARTDTLVSIFDAFGKSEVLPFMLHYPVRDFTLQNF